MYEQDFLHLLYLNVGYFSRSTGIEEENRGSLLKPILELRNKK